MSARPDSVEQTRQQITEATMRLHERVGPAATTLSAVAEEVVAVMAAAVLDSVEPRGAVRDAGR